MEKRIIALLLIVIVIVLGIVMINYFFKTSRLCGTNYIGIRDTTTGQCTQTIGCELPNRFVYDQECIEQILPEILGSVAEECQGRERACLSNTSWCNYTVVRFYGTGFDQRFYCPDVVKNQS